MGPLTLRLSRAANNSMQTHTQETNRNPQPASAPGDCSATPCHCGAGCAYSGTPDEPCWGQVEVEDQQQMEDESDILIHACRGHAAMVNHGDYNGTYLPNEELT